MNIIYIMEILTRKEKKSDNNAYFFSSKSNKIFHGKIIKDILVNGYLGSFDADGENVTEVVYCKFNEDGSVNDVIEQNKLNEDDVEDEKKKLKISELSFSTGITSAKYIINSLK